MFKIFLLLSYSVCCLHAAAQHNDDRQINELINNIAELQVNKQTKNFYAGMFPSFRECGGSPHNYSADNNIFYTAVSVFALKNMMPYLDEKNKITIKEIIRKATAIYPKYRNKRGLPFYSFWANNDVIMPHTFIFQYLKSVFGQGEDADDSVMALLGLDNNDEDNILLKERLLQTSNLSNKKIKSTYKKYRDIPAYSTWVGYRMPVDFDFAVHCNILYFMLEKKLPFVKQDSATVALLAQMVKKREYMKAPVYLSPYYVHSSILIYHLARLMGKFSILELNQFKPQLVSDIYQLLASNNNVMDQIILRTSLMRLQSDAPDLPNFSIPEFEESNQKTFVFFQARAAFSYPTPFKQIFLHWSYIYYYFYCPAYYKILWLEYLVERQKQKNKSK